MAISFKCGGCAKQYTVKDELAGKRAQCKNCNAVMQIPKLPLSLEPDLGADTRDPSGVSNAETVAGSLIHSPIETVAGRSNSAAGRSVAGQNMSNQSAAGRSASGHSVAGRSAAGMSAAGRPAPASQPADDLPPSPPDFGEPLLGALPKVQRADGAAFDVYNDDDQVLKKVRGPAAKNRAPMEPWSALLVVLMLGALGYAAYAAASAPTLPKPYAADVVAEAGKAWGVAGVRYGIYAAAALLLVGPLMIGAWIGALKIMNVRTPDGIYVRSLGIAAFAVGLLALADVNPLATINGVGVLVGAASLGVCFAMLYFVQAQKPVVAGIATGLAALLGGAGLMGMQSAADAAAAPMQTKFNAQLASIQKVHDQKRIVDANKPKTTAVVEQIKADSAAADAAVKMAQGNVDGFKAGLANKRQTRESLAATLATLTAAVETGKQKFPDRTEWDAMAADLSAAKPQIDTFPTAAPPAELAEAPPAGNDWSTRPGRREVSAFGFNLTPPLEGTLDLESRDTPGGSMRWVIGEGRATLTIEQSTAAMPKQQRPWVAPAFIVNAVKDTAFTVTAETETPTEFGTINGLPAAKITFAEGGGSNAPSVVYTLHQGANWLKCTITGTSGDTGLTAAQQAVRSLHARAAGEPAIDPFPAADLVARYQAEPALIDKVIGMLKSKPNAEDAVIKAIGFAPDDATLEKLGPLLIATATEKSSHMLWKLAALGTPLGDQSRDVLRSLEPKTADEIAFAIVDIKTGAAPQVKKGLAALAFADVDKVRQPIVTKALAAGLDDQSLTRGSNAKVLEAVLQKWMDADLTRKLLSMIDISKPGNASTDCRLLAMRALASTGDRKVVMPIFDCVLKDTSAVVETLIAMGPVAEPELDRLIIRMETMRSPVALKAALSVLDEIGTQRSGSALQTIISKSGDPEAKDTAKALLNKIKAKSAAK